MVSSRQSVLIAVSFLAAGGVGHAGGPKGAATTAAPIARVKFLSDDPLWVEPKPRAVRDVKTIEIDDLYDFLEQSFVTPHRIKSAAQGPAQNVNTVGGVPDSEWYTNRHATQRMSIEELKRGPGNANPPDADGTWRVTSAKSDGVTPGFRIDDQKGNHYLLKLDPDDYPELASAADVIGSKIYYALGYNTPENYPVYFRREQLTITDTSYWRDPAGKRHALTARQIDEWLAHQPRDAQGRYRALASRWIDGKPVGPFELEGTRPDDPNDIVAHENHRELRGMRVFAAWLNDTDAKAINTLDSLVTENGVSFIKHYRIDWGASLGSDSLTPKNIRRGHDYVIAPKSTLKETASFGFYLPKWMRVHYPEIHGTGTFDYESFDPLNWKPNYPVTPFTLMEDDDALWAAQKVMAFSDADLRAIVETARYSDPRATDWVTECLIKRRDKIAQAWLSEPLALDNFRLENGRLVFDDLAAKYRVRPAGTYTVQWSAFNNATGELSPVDGREWTVPPSTPTGFLAAKIHGNEAPGGKPMALTVYLRQSGTGWSVVGVERRPEK
jgi:hypothetical protein